MIKELMTALVAKYPLTNHVNHAIVSTTRPDADFELLLWVDNKQRRFGVREEELHNLPKLLSDLEGLLRCDKSSVTPLA